MADGNLFIWEEGTPRPLLRHVLCSIHPRAISAAELRLVAHAARLSLSIITMIPFTSGVGLVLSCSICNGRFAAGAADDVAGEKKCGASQLLLCILCLTFLKQQPSAALH